nr:PREDICTED: uncharacterized protein LOC109038185 isoform X1 [Bemisia tabaci]XP_018908707.1 PREDICTED: uncharacterized protein LOC109038185 isoform X1 [Bemisia tabaci]
MTANGITEQIVMTPKGKTANSTTLMIERKPVVIKEAANDKVHVGGGDHQGIVINKVITEDIDNITVAQQSVQFRVFLVNAQTEIRTQESRTLKFWFKPSCPAFEHPSAAQNFFRDLVAPQDFPRDYVGFIKKIMKLMQHNYPVIRKIEIELKQLDQSSVPARPLSTDETILNKPAEITEKKVLEVIESAYPNPITIMDIVRSHGWLEESVAEYLSTLQTKGFVKAMEHDSFTRMVQDEKQIQIVKQMPSIASKKQPTIAIITAQYCEKVAVDALIENKETFVRYTTVGVTPSLSANSLSSKSSLVKSTVTRFGESNVYTLGNIGTHRIVCTKLPSVGHTREAMTAAGNTTTRLLGTFQKVDYVLLVGLGGGVPHYTDYNKHVRLGDVVVSHPTDDKRYVYTYCDNVRTDDNSHVEFECKEFCPPNLEIQNVAAKLKQQVELNGISIPWLKYFDEGRKALSAEYPETDFARPPPESDKLYMCVGERDIIEVAHPQPSDSNNNLEGVPRVHLGPVASGRAVSRHEQLRQLFALQSAALAFDSEFDSVIDSVRGNCRDSFALVRGIADYRDGTKKSEWQSYAALAAAAVVKAIICAMDPPSD